MLKKNFDQRPMECETMWIESLQSNSLGSSTSMNVYCDNKSTTCIAHNPVLQVLH